MNSIQRNPMKRSDMRVLVLLLTAALSIAALATLAPVGAASPALLVLNKGNLTMVTVDPTTLKVTGSYPSGPDPHEVIASSDGKTAYISNYGGASSITMIDLAAKKQAGTIDLGALTRPHGL